MSDFGVTFEIKKAGDRELLGSLKTIDEVGRRAVDNLDQSFKKATSSTATLEKATSGLGTAMKLIAASVLIKETIALADTYKGLSAQLGLVTSDAANLAHIQGVLFATSQGTRTSLESNVALYAALARSTKDLGLGQGELLAIDKAVAQSFKISGAGANETNGAIRQLSQAFASGVLRGDEFNSIAENAPRLQAAVAKSLGVTNGQLRAMAADGKITSEVLANALLKSAKDIDAEFQRIPVTVGDAMTRVRNSLLMATGAIDGATGSTAGLATAISSIADVIPGVTAQVNAFFGGLELRAIDAAIAIDRVRNAGVIESNAERVKNVFMAGATGNWGGVLPAMFSTPTGTREQEALLTKLRDEAYMRVHGTGGAAGAPGKGTPRPAPNAATLAEQSTLLGNLKLSGELTARRLKWLDDEAVRWRTLAASLGVANPEYGKYLKLAQDADDLAQKQRTLPNSATRAAETWAEHVKGLTLENPSKALKDSFLKGLLPSSEQIDAEIKESVSRIVSRMRDAVEAAKASAQAGQRLDVGGLTQMVREGLVTIDVASRDLAKGLEQAISQTFGEALAKGFETAFANRSIGDGLKAFTATMLAGIGDMMITMGKSMIAFGELVEWFKTALGTLNGGNMVLAGVELIAAGALLKSFSGGIAGGIGGASSSASSGRSFGSSGGIGSITDRGIMDPRNYSSTKAGDITPRPNIIFAPTVIGPNDPGVLRGFDEILRKLNQTGSLSGVAWAR